MDKEAAVETLGREEVPLSRKVRFLTRPSSYAEPTGPIVAIETHMAWVFLTESKAYKLKKPVQLPFLDFSTVEARRRDAGDEVQLNRRLAPDVYLDIVALSLDESGRLHLGEKGTVVDWLVKMRRLPNRLMMSHQIRHDALADDDVRRVAKRLSAFYCDEAPAVPTTPDDYRRRFVDDAAANLEVLRELRYGLPRDAVDAAGHVLTDFLRDAGPLLAARADCVVEAHGDLRPEHVCLETPPVMIDCLAFNRDFRLLDPVDELAFLAMECEGLGAPEVGSVLLDAYVQETGDAVDAALVAFYKAFRAVLRAKLAAWHLDDDGRAESEQWDELWRREALGYVDLAASYADVVREAQPN